MPTRTTAVGRERKLAAILSADVKGYSRLMGEDEEATLLTLTAHRKVMDTLIEQHRGRIVGTAGDSVLAEFASVVDAVQCAVAIQTTLKAENANLLPDRKMVFRIGINLGDVMVEGEQIYGDGVNIAARLESLAEGGGICISGTVYDQIKNKLALRYEDLGEQMVKNIAEPVRVLRVAIDETAAVLAKQFVLRQARPEPSRRAQHERSEKESVVGVGLALPKTRKVGISHRAWVVVIGGVALLVGAIVTMQYLTPSPFSTQDSALRTQAQPALPLPDKPSIVVLPFVNMSEDPKQEYFSDGLTEDLTSDLSKISSLFVIARNSAFTFKGKAVKVQDVSKELGVRYVLEGSVRRADNQVRITAQLIDATTGGHLWSERYDRPLQDIFALQDEVVQKIVTTLKLQLTLQEQGILVRKTTDNLGAYDYYLRGVEHFNRFTQETNTQARQMFEKALALDPQYAEAYAFLGWTYEWEWGAQWSQDPQALERALVLAQQAVALDDSLPLAHSALSRASLWKKQHDKAIAEAERAIALDPNDADGYARLGAVLDFAGRPEEAIGLVEKAMRLNPHYPPSYLFVLGTAYRLMGRYEEAIAAYKKALTHNSNYSPAHQFLAAIYSELGREEEARAEVAEVLRISPNFSLEVLRQRLPYKDPADLERLLDGLRKAGLK
jgi:adenylate cyclase